MKKILLNALLLIVIGNLLIMFLEKILYSTQDIEKIQFELLNYNENNMESYQRVSSILILKIKIWIATFVVLASVLYFIKVKKVKLIRNIVMLFYMLGCLTNLLIIPHPNWLIVALIPIVVVPFMVVPNIFDELKYFVKLMRSNKNTVITSQMG